MKSEREEKRKRKGRKIEEEENKKKSLVIPFCSAAVPVVRPADLLCPAYAHCHTRNEKTHPREEFTRRPLGASLGQPTIRRWLSSTTTSPLDATDAACASSNFVAPFLFLPGSDADQADSIDPIRHDLPNPLIFGIIKFPALDHRERLQHRLKIAFQSSLFHLDVSLDDYRCRWQPQPGRST